MKKKILATLILISFTNLTFAQTNSRTEGKATQSTSTQKETTTEKTATNTQKQTTTTKTEPQAKTKTEKTPLYPQMSQQEQLKMLEKNLAEYNKKDLIANSILYTSIGLASFGFFLFILDAFVEVGDEFTVTPYDDPKIAGKPKPVKSAFGGLTISSAIITAIGISGAITTPLVTKENKVKKYRTQNEILKINPNYNFEKPKNKKTEPKKEIANSREIADPNIEIEAIE